MSTTDYGKASPRRPLWFTLGLLLFVGVFFSAPWSQVTDPSGGVVELSHQGKAAIALFLFAVVWWVTEVIPIGVTSICLAVLQVLFGIRDVRVAFTDFMDPSVWFIIGSLVIGRSFAKTGITKRIAYRMLILAGERTSMIYLVSFTMTAMLTMVMAHTAAVAAVFPVMLTIYMMYEPEFKRTNFGRGLFIGMAFAAGAGSIVTLLGAARGAVALGYFTDIVGRNISFFEISYYMFPIGWLMVLLIWIYFMLAFPPERKTIPGLREKARELSRQMGPVRKREYACVTIVVGVVVLMLLRSFIPALEVLHRSALIMAATVLFFLLHILDVDDLEEIPWNIVLLFGGAMSLGFCLWQTGAARYMAVAWLGTIDGAPWFWFVMGVSLLMLVMTNLVMNVAAVAIILPVALVVAPYLNVSPEIILFSSLVVAGMPFLFLIGAPPNAIAYESRLFTAWEFFRAGIPASIVLMIVLAVFVRWVWPLMGMAISPG
jgi:solute carrier family 13 (sodium-dependent dicarboxylate transporter), member 2/3/5